MNIFFQKNKEIRSNLLFLICLFVLLWPRSADPQGGEVIVHSFLAPLEAPTSESSANEFTSGAKAWFVEGAFTGWRMKFVGETMSYWIFSSDSQGTDLVETENYWPVSARMAHSCPNGEMVEWFRLYRDITTSCERIDSQNRGIRISPHTIPYKGETTLSNPGAILFGTEGEGCCNSNEIRVESTVKHHECMRVQVSGVSFTANNVLTIELRDDLSSFERTYYFDDEKGLIGYDDGDPESGAYIRNWDGDSVPLSETCLEIGREIESRATGPLNIWDYLKATPGNEMETGEYFYAQTESTIEGERLTMCKKEDCEDWQLFELRGDTIYHLEDTTWATDYNENVLCEDGSEAFMRIYNGAGYECGNGQVSGPWGGRWAYEEMLPGDNLTQDYSIVGFNETNYSRGQDAPCCRTEFAGSIVHSLTLRYFGCVVFPNGVVADNALILTTEGGGKENWYFDDERGWIGFDMGVASSGNYIVNWEGDQMEDPSQCWNVGSAAPTSPSLSYYSTDYADKHGRRKPDPTHFYLPVGGNEGLIEQARTATEEVHSLKPIIGGLPNPGWTPDQFTDDLPDYSSIERPSFEAGTLTGVRASLVAAMLTWESGNNRFAGTSNYCEALCSYNICNEQDCSSCPSCNVCRLGAEDGSFDFGNPFCPRETSKYCEAFDQIWEEDTRVSGDGGGAHTNGYTKYNVPLSAAGIYLGHQHCGGAMGMAQAMSTSWQSFAPEIRSLSGKSNVSPWNIDDATVFAGLHLANRYGINDECKMSGGARTGTCFGEICSVAGYWGGQIEEAERIISMANAIAEETGEQKCLPWGQPTPDVIPITDWQTPIARQDIVRISCDASCHLTYMSKPAWDFSCVTGTSVRPWASGLVTFADCDWKGYGCYVKIKHVLRDEEGREHNFETWYGHLGNPWGSSCYTPDRCYSPASTCGDINGLNVRFGQWVDKGTEIGKINLTGCTTGGHLHFEIWEEGRPIDPYAIFGDKSQY